MIGVSCFFVIPEVVVGNPIKKALAGLQWHCHLPPENRIERTVTNIFTNVNIHIFPSYPDRFAGIGKPIAGGKGGR